MKDNDDVDELNLDPDNIFFADEGLLDEENPDNDELIDEED